MIISSRNGGSNFSSKPPITPLPYEKVTLLGLILAANNTSIWMIFSFLPFMVEFYFPSLTKAQLGYYAGILGSAFSGGSLIGNILWGYTSDRYGRRPALLCGLAGTAICSLAFGFSPTFWVAVSFRFLWGLLNGNVGVAKTYLAEISDDSNSAKGMALFGVIGGFGRAIGPVIGGFLSSPAKLYPRVFSHTLFQTYPYALPSLVICTNCIIVFIISCLYLLETLPPQQMRTSPVSSASSLLGRADKSGYSLLNSIEDPEESFDDSGRVSNGENKSSPQKKSIELLPVSSKKDEKKGLISESQFVVSDDGADLEGGSLLSEAHHKNSALQLQGFDEVKNELIPFNDLDQSIRNDSYDGNSGLLDSGNGKKKKNRLTFNGVVEMKIMGTEKLVYSSLKVKTNEHPIIDFSDANSKRTKSSGEIQKLRSFSDEEEEPVLGFSDRFEGSKEDDDTLSISFREKKIRYSNGSEDYFDEDNRLQIPSSQSFIAKLYYLLRRKEIFISTFLYGTNALTMIATNEIFPLWVVTPRELGGFEFTSDQIGISTMICGVISVTLQLTLYPKLVERFGTLATYKMSTIFYAIGAFLSPMIGLLNRSDSPIIQWIGIVTAQILLTVPSSFVLVTIFVFINNSCYSQHRATVNGIGQTFASLGRLTGPYFAARLFAWSETNELTWPFNYYFTFYLIGIITLFNWYFAIFLPRSIERRKREPKIDFMKQINPHHDHHPQHHHPSTVSVENKTSQSPLTE